MGQSASFLNHRLVAVQDGTDCAYGSPKQIVMWCVFLGDPVHDTAEGDPRVLGDGGLYEGGSWLSLTRSPFSNHHHTFPGGSKLQIHTVVVN